MVENQEIKVEVRLDEKLQKDLMDMTHYKNWEYSVKEIVESLENKGYECMGKIVKNALYENIFFVNTVDDDGSVWLKLGDEGEKLWYKYNKGKEGYSESIKNYV